MSHVYFKKNLVSLFVFSALLLECRLLASDKYSELNIATSPKADYYKEFDPQVDVTPTARGCPHSSGPYAVGSFIYWKSQLEKEDVIDKVTTQITPALTETIKQKETDFKYAPGFKLGIGYNFKRDYWDALLNWTLLNSNKSHKSFATSGAFPAAGSDVLFFPLPPSDTDAIFSGSMHSHWSLHFTTLDFELGRNFFISRNISLRPFLGLKASWIDWKFKNQYRNFLNFEQNPTGPFDTILKEDNRGIGPRMGINTRWVLSSYNFALFGNLAGSLLYTNLKGKKTFNLAPSPAAPPGFIVITKAHRHELQPVVEYAIGLDWSHCLRQRYNIYVSAGYEAQLWSDQTATELNDGLFFLNGEIHAIQALMFHGLTMSLRLDF